LARNVAEHTITQSVRARDRPADWKALESFAASGAGDAPAVTRNRTRLVAQAPGRIWHGYHVGAVDDTKVHRNSQDVWGTCTFQEYTARCPNRATTVRAHHWVVLGALRENAGRLAWFLPLSGRLSFRQSQLPTRGGAVGPREPFRTTGELVVDLLREQARILTGRHLGVVDGGYALQRVVRPLVRPEDGSPRIAFLTRLRQDARLFAPPPPGCRAHQKGGHRWPPPRQGGRWTRPGHEATAVISGRRRKVRWKEVVCLGWVAGPEVPVTAVVAKVAGNKKRFPRVTSAVELTGLPMVEWFAARFRPEDAFRDLKQRLGWEECRGWTRNPIERTSPAPWVTMSLMRLAQFRLESAGEEDWWLRPPWNREKDRPSVRDVERLFRRHGPEIQQRLSAWLG
jgi:hypothetical protein